MPQPENTNATVGHGALGVKEITPTLKPEVEGKLNMKF